MVGDIGLTPEDLVRVPASKSKAKSKPSNGNSLASFFDGADWADLALQARALWIDGRISMGMHEGFRDMAARARAQRASYVEGAVHSSSSDTQTREQSVTRVEQLLEKRQIALNDAETAMRLARSEESILNQEINGKDVKTAAAARAGLIELRERRIPDLQVKVKETQMDVEDAQKQLRYERGEVPRLGGRAQYGSAEDRS
jgi:hypothetical protein